MVYLVCNGVIMDTGHNTWIFMHFNGTWLLTLDGVFGV